MDTKDAYIEQLENTINSLQQQVNNLTEMVLLTLKGEVRALQRESLEGRNRRADVSVQ